MKIDPNMAIGSVGGTQVKPKTGLTGGFDEVLKGLETDTATKEASKAGAPMLYGPVNPQKMNALNTSEDALELLEKYSQAVSNPNMNLKTLEPMVNELETMRDKVVQAGSFIADNDPLKGIMNDVSSTLYGEVAKFRRGELIG
jgi:hypothetical protein